MDYINPKSDTSIWNETPLSRLGHISILSRDLTQTELQQPDRAESIPRGVQYLQKFL